MRFGSKGFKLIILDECDAMTKDAQCRAPQDHREIHQTHALLPHRQLRQQGHPRALQSRCTRFRFAPLGPDAVKERVSHVVESEGLDMSPDAVDATCALGAGDMRRTLNILQSTFLAKTGGGAIEADDVYATTGQPRPEDIERVASVLLNEPFAEAAVKTAEIQAARGLALADVVRQLCEYVFRLHLPPKARARLVSEMADVEHRLAYVTHEKMQLYALVGAFAAAKEDVVKAAVN